MRLKAAAADGPVFLGAGPGEPRAVLQAWAEAPELLAGLHLATAPLPGLNRFDPPGLNAACTLETPLMTAELRTSFARGQARLLPMHYSAVYERWRVQRFAACVFSLSLPDAEGFCALGPCADFAPAAFDGAGLRVAILNHRLPPANGPRLPLAAFDLVVEADDPLAELAEPAAGEALAALAAQAARFIPDGAMLQCGVGKIPAAILPHLTDRRGLRIHSGLIAPGHLELLRAGAIVDAPGAILTGVAMGGGRRFTPLRQATRGSPLRLFAIRTPRRASPRCPVSPPSTPRWKPICSAK